MKKLLFIVLAFVLGMQASGYSQKTDNEQKDKIVLDVKEENNTVDTSNSINIESDSNASDDESPNKTTNEVKKCENDLGIWEWIYICLPFIFLVIYTIIFSKGIYKGDDKNNFLINMLSEGEGENSILVPSKFVLFISGMTAIIVSLFILSLYGYMVVAQCGNQVDFSDLWQLVTSLGIGVIPYGFYMFSNRNEDTNNNSRENIKI